MLGRWGKMASSTWNISGDPCTGSAIDNSINIDDGTNNPFIKCICTDSICHITELYVRFPQCRILCLLVRHLLFLSVDVFLRKVYALDVTGPVPEELLSLPRLTNLWDYDLSLNYIISQMFVVRNKQAWFYNIISFSYILCRNLDQNYLTGPLPAFIGNLTDMVYLCVISFSYS